jgi:hypothetical protein
VEDDHFQYLTDGLTVLDFGHFEISGLAVFGEKAFPIATNSFDRVIVAAGEYGKVFH